MGCNTSKDAKPPSTGSVGDGSKPKLEYFTAAYARADPIRFLLYHAKVDFDDATTIPHEWERRKKAGNGGEFGTLPILTY